MSFPNRTGGFSRRRLLQGGIAAGAALAGGPLLLAACGGDPTGMALTAKRKTSLTWADAEIAPNLAPFGAVSTATVVATTLIYDSLLSWDRNLNIHPALAESYKIVNPLTYVFNLRKGVRFHSGKELDSEDVVYSMGLQASPPPPGVTNAYYPAIAKVEATDKYTVTFQMEHPDATVFTYLAWGWFSAIVPNGMYEKLDPRSKADGTGPFQLTSFDPNDHISFSANPQSWRKGPYVDSLTIKLLADLESRVSALRSGEIQGASIDADSAQVLKDDSNVKVLKGLTAAFRELEITIKGDGKPWDDVRVRQAMNFGINRQAIIDKVYAGQAEYSSKIPPGYGTWPLSQQILKSKYEKYDVAQAKSLLKQAGFSGGFPVTLQSISEPADYTQIAQVIAEQLSELKIDVTVQPVEIGIAASNVGSGNFEWFSTGRGMRGDPSGYMADFNTAGSTYKAWYNGGYQNQTLFNLINKATTITNVSQRHQMYDQMQEIILTDWPTMPLVNPMVYQAVSSTVHDMYVAYDSTDAGLKQASIK